MHETQHPRPRAYLDLSFHDKVEMVCLTVEFARLSDAFLDSWIELLQTHKDLYPQAGKPIFSCPTTPLDDLRISSPFLNPVPYESVDYRK